MIDLFSLIKSTSAYQNILAEKKAGKLSHAYLITCSDQYNLSEFMKIFASLIACKEIEPCFDCRTCKLIQEKNHPDVIFYPKGEKDVVVEDVNNLIEESVIKPLESDKKLFVILDADKMNTRAQNKLLKTLEEPPKNVHILLGAKTDYPLLQTVKSRVKKFEIPTFSSAQIFEVLKEDCYDLEKLKSAIACGDGTVGKAKALYFDENLKDCIDASIKVLCEMKTSADVLEYSAQVLSLKCGTEEFLSVLDLMLRNMLLISQGKEDLIFFSEDIKMLKTAEGYNTGSILHILDKIVEAKKRKMQNANAQMLVEWLLFQILEGKYKWRKL